MRARHLLILVTGCLLALGSAQATAAGVVTGFTLTPASTQAGADPDVTADLTFSYSDSTDSVKRVTITLAPGLLASIVNVPATCSAAQLTTNTCPAGAQIGTGSVTTNGTPRAAALYLMPSLSPGDGAGLGVVVLVGASVYTGTGTLDVVTGADGQPVGKVDVGIPVVPPEQVNAISATMHGTTTDGRAFTRLPTSCSSATSSASAQTNEAGSGSGSNSFVPTGCPALGYAPALSAVQVIKDPGGSGAELIATISQPNVAAESATEALELDWPASVSPFASLGACLTGTPCTIGTATAASPLAPPSYLSDGTVTLGGSAVAPTLTVAFPAPVPLTLTGAVDLAAGKVTFPSTPDVPLSAMTVDITGPPGGGRALSTNCTAGDLVAKFTPQTGAATVTSPQPIVYRNCPASRPKPPAPKKLRVSISSNRSVVIHRRAQARLACRGGAVGSICRGTFSLTYRQRIVRRVHRRRRVIHRTIVLARARYAVASGRAGIVTLRLSAAGMQLLEHSSHRRLSVRATATLRGGTATQRTIVVQLAPPPRRSA